MSHNIQTKCRKHLYLFRISLTVSFSVDFTLTVEQGGRSDRVARLGYLLRTFRQCCYYFSSTSAISITNSATTTISTTSTIFRFFYYFSFYYYFQILLLFQLLLLLSDSSDQFILHLCFAIIAQLPAFTRVFCRKCIF